MVLRNSAYVCVRMALRFIRRFIGHDWPSWFRTISRIHIRHVYKTYQIPAMQSFNISFICCRKNQMKDEVNQARI